MWQGINSTFNTKRLLDIAISIAGLIALFPLFVVIGVAIKINSKGPLFYSQERIGRGFRPFRIHKFRTMVRDADRNGPLITRGGDPRVTRLGELLRKNKLDELPQLLNVLLGQMSLVGPRPEIRPYVEKFRADYETILSVRPGITDLASLKYANEESVLAAAVDWEEEYVRRVLPEKMHLAKKYVQKSSLSLDFIILIATVRQLLN
ncbi:MAG: sugar transferase [Deltaproteobacteria bacterium]|nr:sugar transferase [Deltaproteobacteria bacterium]